MFITTIEIKCTDKSGCKQSFKTSGADMTRGKAMGLAQKDGWKHISAEEHLCPKHAAASAKAPASKTKSAPKKAKKATKERKSATAQDLGQKVDLEAIRERISKGK